VAAELLDQFHHGVWFVELAPLADPEFIPQTILSTIGIREQTGKTPLETLKEYLYEKKVLLVLDNCEHLIDASAKLTNTLLNAAPGLKVMASSREALGVKGELSYPVPSLALPDIKHLPVAEQLSQYEAVRCSSTSFLVSPHFDIDRTTPLLAQICCRLDGILCIESPGAKVMSVEQISRRLDDASVCDRWGAYSLRVSKPARLTTGAMISW
jgi:non-specific serine/threonine protein kinase